MPGINTTGGNNTKDYNLGRGIVYFATLNPTTGLPVEYRDLGNAPEFSANVEVENLEHQSSRTGLKTTDLEVVVSQKINLNLTLDEINFGNLALFFSGESSSPANSATVSGITSITNYVSSAVLGRWYDIRTTAGARAYDIEAGDLTLTKNGGSALVLGTDYTVDAKMGRFFLLSTATGIAAGNGIDLVLAADGDTTSVTTYDQVKALTKTAVRGALKFISENAQDGILTEYQFHQVALKANGDFGLIAEEFTQMQLTGVAEINSLVDTVSPLYIRTFVDSSGNQDQSDN